MTTTTIHIVFFSILQKIILLPSKDTGKMSMVQENCNLLSFARFEEEMKDT